MHQSSRPATNQPQIANKKRSFSHERQPYAVCIIS